MRLLCADMQLIRPLIFIFAKIQGMKNYNLPSYHPLADKHAYDVLLQAEHCWTNMDSFRKQRNRCLQYTYGDQLSDIVRDEHGRRMTERQFLKGRGGQALSNNMIRKLVSTLKGTYINQNLEPICVARDRDEQTESDCLSELLTYVNDINDGISLYADIFEDYVVSGAAVCKKTYNYVNDRLDCWTTVPDLDLFFIDNNMKDSRGWDCNIIGEIHDMSWNSLLNYFAKSNADIEKLRKIYHYAASEAYILDSARQFGRKEINSSFLLPTDSSMCRVIEVWTKERKPRYHCYDHLNGELFKCELKDKRELVDMVNSQRMQQAMNAGVSEEEITENLITAEWFMDNYWYFRYFAPTGEVIMEGETPYEHGQHPYVFKFYPFINSEIHPFVADVIELQRHVNRLLNLNDYLMRTSAKGLLAVPVTALEGTNLTIEDLAEVWARPGGVFVYKPKAGVPLPSQITNSVQNLGIADLISMERSFFDDITGVNAALQGKSVGNVSGAYYAQQTQNAAVSLQGILTSFSSFRKQSALKDCKNIQQYYDTDRIVSIVGRDGRKIKFNPSKVKDISYDINISESQTSPVFRQVANDFLIQIWQSGQISLKAMLEAGAFPFGDKLLSIINTEQQQLQEMQQQQQLNNGGNADEQSGQA